MEYGEKTNKGEQCKMERRVLTAPPDSDIIYTVNNSKKVKYLIVSSFRLYGAETAQCLNHFQEW